MQKLIDTLKSFELRIGDKQAVDVKKALWSIIKMLKKQRGNPVKKSRVNVTAGKNVLRQQKKP